MSTPKLTTAVKHQIDRNGQGMQTCFPAKVLKWHVSSNTVQLEPQFIETWVDRQGVRNSETGNAAIDNVPVCYPWHMTWDITVGAFGLVFCTKYSLDQWRQQLRRMDPGDLRKFTMSGATFHPVVIGESPNATQQFVALANLVKGELDKIVVTLGTGVVVGAGDVTWGTEYTASEVASTTVKVSE